MKEPQQFGLLLLFSAVDFNFRRNNIYKYYMKKTRL